MWPNFQIGPKNYHGPNPKKAQSLSMAQIKKSNRQSKMPKNMAQTRRSQSEGQAAEYAGHTKLVRLAYSFQGQYVHYTSWVRPVYSPDYQPNSLST